MQHKFFSVSGKAFWPCGGIRSLVMPAITAGWTIFPSPRRDCARMLVQKPVKRYSSCLHVLPSDIALSFRVQINTAMIPSSKQVSTNKLLSEDKILSPIGRRMIQTSVQMIISNKSLEGNLETQHFNLVMTNPMLTRLQP